MGQTENTSLAGQDRKPGKVFLWVAIVSFALNLCLLLWALVLSARSAEEEDIGRRELEFAKAAAFQTYTVKPSNGMVFGTPENPKDEVSFNLEGIHCSFDDLRGSATWFTAGQKSIAHVNTTAMPVDERLTVAGTVLTHFLAQIAGQGEWVGSDVFHTFYPGMYHDSRSAFGYLFHPSGILTIVVSQDEDYDRKDSYAVGCTFSFLSRTARGGGYWSKLLTVNPRGSYFNPFGVPGQGGAIPEAIQKQIDERMKDVMEPPAE